MQDARLAAQEARARAALAKASLERAIIRSPIDGTVLQVNVRVGEFVSAGGKVPVIIGDISRLQIRCDIDEQMAPRMRENLPAKGYLKGEVNVNTLPKVMHEPAKRIRSTIDELSLKIKPYLSLLSKFNKTLKISIY